MIFNVVVSVVALVEAKDEEEAIDKLRARIRAAGLVAMDDEASGKYANAFASESGEADF